MRTAVVGHVDFVEFLRVPRVPEVGEIVQAEDAWGEAGGGGGVASVRLRELSGDTTFFTALGADPFGREAERQLREHGVRVVVDWYEAPQRRAFCYLDDEGERTITLLSPKLRPRRSAPLPWHELAGVDGVYFTGGDPDALRAARAARVLVATPRELPTLRAAGVELDALVGSATDPSETYEDGDLDPPPKLVVWTEGSAGGHYAPGAGRWSAPELPGARLDTYGAGDTFAAALTFALAQGSGPQKAVELAARAAAAQVTRRAGHGTHA
ncbi:MAG: ribokinase [Thermoleophilia bacterium]|nr:ribokinase [Thermoleophilia bacterium]